MFLSVSSVLLLLASTVLFPDGHAASDSVHVMAEVTITATRSTAGSGGPPVRVTQIGPRAISSVAFPDVGTLLAARSGGFVRQYGPGGLATLSFRGASPEQTLLLVDGLPLTDLQLGQVDLTLLPTAVLDQVEVVHGAGSALYGSAGMAGVVNLRTLPSSVGTLYSAAVGAGAFGSRHANLRLAHGTPRLSGMVTADLIRADNDFPYRMRVGGVPREVRRHGAEMERATLYATGEYVAGRHRLRAAGWRTAALRGLPGPSTTPTTGEQQWDDQLRLWVSDRLLLRRGMVRISASTHWNRLRYVNPQLSLDQTGRTELHALEVEHFLDLGGTSLTVGGTADYGTARHPSLGSSARVLHGALFLAAAHRTVGTFPALRLDVFEGGDGQTMLALAPRLGVRRPLPLARLEAYGSVGRAFRAPTINERYWQPGGNPHLRPERGWSADAGARRAAGAYSAELSVFGSLQRDQIAWLPSPAGYYAPFNLRRTRTIGFEASLDARSALVRDVEADAGARFTYTHAVDLTDPARTSYGRQLRYVPREQFKLYAAVHSQLLTIHAASQIVGRRFVTTDGTQWVGPHWVADVRLSVRVPAGSNELELSAALNNVLNARYDVVQHYPMPPRHLGVYLTVRSRRPHP